MCSTTHSLKISALRNFVIYAECSALSEYDAAINNREGIPMQKKLVFAVLCPMLSLVCAVSYT